MFASNCFLDKDIRCKNRSTPLQILVKSNVFLKNDMQSQSWNEKKSDVISSFSNF